MDCRQAATLLGAYADEELDPRSTLEIEEHLKTCASCAPALQNHHTLKTALRSRQLAYPAPAALRRRILAVTAAPAPSRLSGWLAWRPLTLATAFAVVALVLSNGALRWRSVQAENLLADEVIAGHIRSLQGAHLMDVPSSNKHTVKPWFAGKIDFSPSVEDLATEGFPLIGGRLDYLDGRPVAALVYRRAAHTINLFVWPASGEMAQRARTERGLHAVHWTHNGMTYWAVSDLNEAELTQFAFLLNSRE